MGGGREWGEGGREWGREGEPFIWHSTVDLTNSNSLVPGKFQTSEFADQFETNVQRNSLFLFNAHQGISEYHYNGRRV